MAAYYTNWADARQYLDNTTVGDVDIPKLQALSEVQDARFDGRLRRMYDVPFVLAEDPDSFEIAKKVCGMWAAAAYLRESLSAEGTEENAWWANYLDQMAEDLIAALENLGAPDDAEAAADPLQHIPYDGGDRPAAVFKRDNVTGGVLHHEDHW